MRARGRRAGVTDLVFRPVWRFVRDYVVYSGWRDGPSGFVVASVSAFSVFLKYACLLTLPKTPPPAKPAATPKPAAKLALDENQTVRYDLLRH